ncbi:peroxisomal membrane protein PMP34-like [Tympanuchus pallidicinctus]|uniref:peroxisomal membrane protein PMP34-like n=1 Tax=Tympanuchus pallidicinctus TaxID=109042 RepID=UPI0022870495|nr:peroxisomal membrane protein PMP34-like [Tympanuchus pallidicinctus]
MSSLVVFHLALWGLCAGKQEGCLWDFLVHTDLPRLVFALGVVNVLLTTPLWVVNTRLKLQGAKFRNEDIVPTNYKGIIDAFHQIIRDEGALALWNGTFPSLLLVFNPAIQFMFYEGFKRKLLKKQTQLTSLDAFVMGAVAKAVATTLTYPLQTVQSILRLALLERALKVRGIC